MAAQIDGSIVVDAGINTENFNRGSDALKREMAQLQKQFDSVSKRLESSVSRYVNALATGDGGRIRHFSDELGKAQDAANRFRDVVSRLGDEYRSMSADIDKAQTALNRLQDRQAKMKATGVKENSKAYQSLMYDIQQAQSTLEEYKAGFNAALGIKDNADATILNPKQLQEFANVIEGIKARLSALQKDEGVESLVNDIEKAASAVERYQARVDKMSALGATESQWESIRYDISKAAESAGALAEELTELNQYGGIDKGQYDTLSQRLQEVISQYDALARATARTGNETETASRRMSLAARVIKAALTPPVYALGALKSAVAGLGVSLVKMTGSAVLYFMKTLAQSAGEAAQNMTRMTARAVTGGIRRLGAWLSNAAKSMTLFGRSAKRNNGVLKKSFTTILKYGLGIRSLYFLFNKIRAAIKEGFQNLARYSDDVNKSVSQVISSFTRFKNQFAATFAPIVNVALPALAKFIDLLSEATFRTGQFFAALSGQKTVIRAKEVQEDYAASLDETKKAAKAAEKQLAGFDELNILKKPDKDEGLKPEDMFETVEVEDEAKDFADAFKEAWVNVDLSGIGKILGGKIKVALDDIPWDKIKQGASNMGKRLATFLNGLISVPDLGASIGKSIAEAINAAFAFLDGFAWNFNWKSLGNSIMDMIEAACDNLNWTLINHALQGLAIGLANLLNTIFSRVEVWKKVGRTIGKGINAAVLFGLTFLERFDFKQAASAIVAGLNAAIATIRFDNIGQLLGDLLGGALQFLYTAVTGFDWEGLGNQIAVGVNAFTSTVRRKIYDINWADMGAAVADGLNTAIIGIEWGGVGETVGMLFGGALTAAASFIRGLDYGAIVQAIQDFFSNAIQQINWYDLLTVWGVAALMVALKKIIVAHPFLAILVGAVLALGPELGNAIDKMISDIPWADVGKAIGDSLIWVLGRLNEAAENADWIAISESLFRGLTEMILNIDWLKLVGLLGEWLINCFVMSVDIVLGALAGIFHAIGDALEEAGHDVIGGFFKGVGNAFIGIGQWLHEHIFDPFINAWKALWQIGSPSKVMEEQGGFIVSGLFNGISAAWHFVTDFFGSALDGLKLTFGGAWDAIKQGASDAWNGISGTLSGVWNHIKTNAFTSLSELNKTASAKWADTKTDAIKTWNELKASVGQTISGVKQEAVSKVSETVNSIKPQWARIKTDAAGEWNGLKSSVVSSALSVKSQVASAFTSLQGTLSGVWGNIKSAASGALSSVSATVSSMVTSISSRVASVRATVSNITSSASDALSKVANKMDDLTRKASNGVSLGGFASGGVIRDGGRMTWWDSVRKYASGTLKAAGSLFVAGEAGPELVGHVNGRTEVLNESQIAGAIYGAVLAAMQEAVSTLGGFLSQQMASNTNALITAIGQIQAPPQIAAPQDTAMLERLAALQAVPYQVPAYATGTIMPYEVVAEIRRSTDKITGCIDDNAEEMIQAMIGAFSSQTAALVSALNALKELGGQRQGASFRDIKDAANEWTQMYGKSPFYG